MSTSSFEIKLPRWDHWRKYTTPVWYLSNLRPPIKLTETNRPSAWCLTIILLSLSTIALHPFPRRIPDAGYIIVWLQSSIPRWPCRPYSITRIDLFWPVKGLLLAINAISGYLDPHARYELWKSHHHGLCVYLIFKGLIPWVSRLKPIWSDLLSLETVFPEAVPSGAWQFSIIHNGTRTYYRLWWRQHC